MASTSNSQEPPLHDSLKNVHWLLGKWEGEGCGVYPTISPFSYKEEVTFGHNGQPMLTYQSKTWTLENNVPMHNEMGFLRMKPGSLRVAFIIAQSNGLAEVEEGEVKEQEIHFASNSISRMTFGSDPKVLKIERIYKLLDPNTLELCCFMETSNTRELHKHLHITYKKVPE